MGSEYVVQGATLKCTMGTASVKLMVTPHMVQLKGKNKANIGDFLPMVNIPSFGSCNVTAPPKPCTPACCMWLCGKNDVLIGNLPALLSSSMTMCAAGGGSVSITDSGQ